jgi:hypothetical protein
MSFGAMYTILGVYTALFTYCTTRTQYSRSVSAVTGSCFGLAWPIFHLSMLVKVIKERAHAKRV